MPHLRHKVERKEPVPSRFLSASQVPFFPVRILSSMAITMILVFLIMVCWWLMAPATMAVVNALAPQISVEGNPALAILRHIINLWGVVGVVIVLIYYALSQAQRHDWRGEYF